MSNGSATGRMALILSGVMFFLTIVAWGLLAYHVALVSDENRSIYYVLGFLGLAAALLGFFLRREVQPAIRPDDKATGVFAGALIVFGLLAWGGLIYVTTWPPPERLHSIFYTLGLIGVATALLGAFMLRPPHWRGWGRLDFMTILILVVTTTYSGMYVFVYVTDAADLKGVFGDCVKVFVGLLGGSQLRRG